MAFQRRANPPCTPRCVPRAPSSPPSAWPGPWPARERGTLHVRTLVPPRRPSGRLQRQAAPRVRAAGAHLLRLWLDRLRLCSSLRLGDLRAPGHPGSKPWHGWDVAQAEGPLTLVTRREAKQSQRTLGAATFFSPAGFCVGRAKPGQRSPCHEACPGLGQRCTQLAGAPWPSAPWAWSPSASSRPQPARGGPVSGLPGGPPHNSGFAGRPSLPRAPNAQSWQLCLHMQGLWPGQGQGRAATGRQGCWTDVDYLQTGGPPPWAP